MVAFESALNAAHYLLARPGVSYRIRDRNGLRTSTSRLSSAEQPRRMHKIPPNVYLREGGYRKLMSEVPSGAELMNPTCPSGPSMTVPRRRILGIARRGTLGRKPCRNPRMAT